MSSKCVYHKSCDKCGSSDGNGVFDDGHEFCFVCNTYGHGTTDVITTTTEIKRRTGLELEPGGEYIDLKGTDDFYNRGLIKNVCEKFGVKIKRNNEGEVAQIVFPYYTPSGDYVAQKIRKKAIQNKGMWHGDNAAAQTFFGQQVFSSGRKIVVTEGEFDALAVYQMFGQKFPVVSLRNGADKSGSKATEEFKKNFEYFKNFQEIVLCFDNDEPGMVSAAAVAKLFPPSKLKIMHMNKHKDANEYLKSGDTETFVQEFWQAKALSPQGIVYGTELRDRIITKLKERHSATAVKYPWEGLNKLTYGIRPEEMVTIISGTGMGKSAVIGELVYHILMNSAEKIGIMMLEESVEMANLRMASLHANKPYHLPDTEWTEEELKQMLKETVELTDATGNSRVISFDHFGSNGIDETLFRIDHMVALGCKYLFLDHISILVSDQQHGDERRALDEIATKLRTKVQEHGVSLFIVSHLRRTNSKPHEEGGQTSLADIRGTQAIAQLSDIVIGLERNGQAESEIERNTTTLRVLKNRFSGFGGEACKLFFDRETGRLAERTDTTDEVQPMDTPPRHDQAPLSADVATAKPPVNWQDGDELPF